MKRIFFAFLAVAGCSQDASGDEPNANTTEVISLLKKGSGEACTNEATVEVIRSIVYGPDAQIPLGSFSPAQQQDFHEQLVTGLEMVTLSGIDRETGKVSCRGKFFATWNTHGGDVFIDYDVQPALDGGFVVNLADTRGARQAYSLARGDYYAANIKATDEAKHQNWLDRSAYANATGFCSAYQGRPVTAYDKASARRIIEAGDALGIDPNDPTYACVKRSADAPPRGSEPTRAEIAPDEAQAPEPKEDRIEATLPPGRIDGTS